MYANQVALLVLLACAYATAFVSSPVVPTRAPPRGRPCTMMADGEGEGNPLLKAYTGFREWQLEKARDMAESNPKYEEYLENLMTLEKMPRAKAERLARLAVSDPIGYGVERKKAAAAATGKKYDYRKIDGFFPMDWIMSGDFGWGYMRKKRRLEEEAAKKK